MRAMAGEAKAANSNVGNKGNCLGLGHMQSIEAELVQRNREIAKVRDSLHQRESEIQIWKERHSELVGRLADVDGELTKARAQYRRTSRAFAESAGSSDDIVGADVLRAENAELKRELANLRSDAAIAFQQPAVLRAEATESQRQPEDVRVKDSAHKIADTFEQVATPIPEAPKAHGTLEHDLESDCAVESMQELRKKLADALEEVGAARFDAAKSQRMLEKELGKKRATEELENKLADALEQVTVARADAAESQRLLEKELASQHSRASVEELEKRLAGALQQAAAAKADAAESQKLLENERKHARTFSATVELEQQLASERQCLSAQLQDLEVRLISEMRGRREAEDMHASATKHLKEALEKLMTTTDKLEASEKTSADTIARLEDQLQASSHFESRSRALQTECVGLRSEVNLIKRKSQEFRESFAMVAEEARTHRIEDAAENARLRLQLEETRRARSVEMHALVTKMKMNQSGGAKQEA
mmetsp:Transcript_76301/g.120140  ORF Transcript_76301/g.120140 Transcript_76301/m.120140 type:complete len:483 (+) Transcript_76301:24-1472(+)